MAWMPIRPTRLLAALLGVVAVAVALVPVATAAGGRTTTRPSDPGFSLEWALENRGQTVLGHRGTAGADVSALTAWTYTRGEGVTIGVVDSGVQSGNANLRLAGNVDLTGEGTEDATGHGTAISGIIAAPADGNGTVGLAPAAKTVSLRALGSANRGDDAVAAAAIDRAAGLGLRIVNLSLSSTDRVPLTEAAIARHPDTLYVVAAGNDGQDVTQAPTYPCATPADNVLCVGASDADDRPVASSNVSSTYVDLFAPGDDILSPTIGSGYAYETGTSMAAALVSGAAALVLSVHPQVDAAGLRAALVASVDKRSTLGASVSGGRLDAAAAILAVGQPLSRRA